MDRDGDLWLKIPDSDRLIFWENAEVVAPDRWLEDSSVDMAFANGMTWGPMVPLSITIHEEPW